MGIAQAEYEVAVEVDQIDAQAREGWSCWFGDHYLG